MRFAIVLLLLAPAAWAVEEPAEIPFALPTPEGWRTETIPFPLDFAPELDYDGVEELRFAPGMFERSAEDYWTYAFVWWVSLDTDPGAERLQSDLEAYFRGLTHVVAESRGFDPGEPVFHAVFEEQEEPKGSRSFSGTVQTFDAFASRSPVRLGVRVDSLPCEESGRRALVFLLSPQPSSHAIWTDLEEIRAGFRCSR